MNHIRPALYQYQEEGIGFLGSQRRAILADEMGLGKTRQAIEALSRAGSFPVLVVCPNTAKHVWESELNAWAPALVHAQVSGTPAARQATLDRVSAGEVMVTIINYEAVRVTPGLRAVKWAGMILDEAHRVKNRKAQVTQAVRDLARGREHLYVLTGTPFMNRPSELWSLLNIVDPASYRSYWRFVETYCHVRQGRWGWEVEGLKNEDQLRAELRPYLLRRAKSQVGLELPPVTFQEAFLDMNNRQRSYYDRMAEDMLVEFEDGETVAAPIVLAKLTRLRQLATAPSLLQPDTPAPSNKYEAALSLIRDSPDEKQFIIYSVFATAVQQLAEFIERSVTLTGQKTTKQRAAAIKDFQAGEARVLLASIGAGSEAITLTAADTVIFLDRDWTPTRNDQAVARSTRIGQTKPLHVYSLVSLDTIDEAISKLLAKKQTLFDRVLSPKALRLLVRGEEVK